MAARVVVLGAGYAGTTVIQRLERGTVNYELTWVSRDDYHLVLHEVHRAIRNPDAGEKLTVPLSAIAAPSTTVVTGEVVGLDAGERTVALADGRDLDYDYLVIALGSRTAFYGIPGLQAHAHTLKSLDDALAIHEAVVAAAGEGDDVAAEAGDVAREAGGAAAEAGADDPARVVVGGAGLSGVQAAGEVAELRDERDLPVEVTLAEAMDEVMPGTDPGFQRAVRERIEAAGIDVVTGDPVVEATADAVHFDEREPLPYDVLVWTGGITGPEALSRADLATNHGRVETDATFRTSDDRVFAVGDTALIEQGDTVAPPTAQAAWQAGDVLAGNVARAIDGRPLETWTFRDKGTVVSVGDRAVANGVVGVPVETFDGLPARVLKKAIAARWIKDVASYRRAISAWGAL